MSSALTAEDLPLRAPVWGALSYFWLDTKLQDFQFDYIARMIAASPYSIEDVIAIHHYEVAPAVSANLGSIAGEWAGFDIEWLNTRCQYFASRRASFWFRTRIVLQLPFQWIFTVWLWRRLIPQIQSIRRVEANSTQLTNR